jgi:hypothetical protein
MIRASGEEASAATFTCGLFDLKARQLIEMTPEWNRAVGVERPFYLDEDAFRQLSSSLLIRIRTTLKM